MQIGDTRKKSSKEFTSQMSNITDYNLGTYTRDLCKKLKLECNNDVVDSVIYGFNMIKKVHGSKRAKVKDSIILICLGLTLDIEVMELSKKLAIENKVMYNTRKLFTSIPELAEFLNPINSFDYISEIYNSSSQKLDKDPLPRTRDLINLLKKYNILQECKPNTIGVTCLYYVLVNLEYDVDVYKFSRVYKVSDVTIKKTYAKLTIEMQKIASRFDKNSE